MKPFNETDVRAAHDELRREAQKLVDRFGQAQAFEIIMRTAHDVAPEGASQTPTILIIRNERPKAVN